MSLVPSIRSSRRAPIVQVLKTSAAAVLAWLLSALLLAQPLPIFAAIAALLVVQPSVSQSLVKGVERSVGVIGGVVLAYLVGILFPRSSALVLAVIVASLLIAWALRLGPGSTNQVPISAMLVLALGDQTPAYAIDRVLETIIGAVVALVVNVAIVPPVLLRPAHLAVGRLLRETAITMERLSVVLAAPTSNADLDRMLEQARALRPLRDDAATAVAEGAESLTLNPRRGRHRRVLERDAELLDRLTKLVTRVIGMARAIHDRYDDSLHDDPDVQGISRELARAAHDLRLLDREKASGGPEPITDELPALTAPITISRPSEEHWVLIGSLLEDVRRVRDEVTGSDG